MIIEKKRTSKQKKRDHQQSSLLTIFEGDYYQEKQVGDKWLVKMWNGTTNKWQVAIYSELSFRRYKNWNPFGKEF